MRKLMVLLSIIIIAFSMTACTTTTTTTDSEIVLDDSLVATSPSDYEINYDGLVEYMKDNQLLAGDGSEMSYDFIGAIAGEKFTYTEGSNQFSCELYEFDTENLSSKAQEVIASVTENGYFEALGTEVEATMSNSNNFLMVLAVTAADDTGTDMEEKIITMFKDFE